MPTHVEFVDTSILLNLLDVPGKNQERDAVLVEFTERRALVEFVLPVTAVVETGNHIAQLPDGWQRRSCAERFVAFLQQIVDGATPWVLHEFEWDERFLRDLMSGASTSMSLVSHAEAKVGCGDLCILAERDRFKLRTASGLRVDIWTKDQGLLAWS